MLRSLIAGTTLAFAGSRANITRTILSCAGIVVGVGALVLVVTASDFGQRFVTAFSESNFGQAATFQVSISEEVDDTAALEADLRRAGAEEVSLIQTLPGEARIRVGDDVLDDVHIVAVDVELGDIRRMDIVSGRWFTDADQESLAPALVVNERLAEQLGERAETETEIGTDTWLATRFVGVIANTTMDFGGNTAYLLRGPASEDMLSGGADDELAELSYQVRIDPSDPAAEPFSDVFAERLAGAAWRWGVDDPRNSVFAYRMDDAEEINAIITYVAWGLMGIAAITLSTGLLGVLNVGLVTVRERKKELATYRALGASRLTLFIAVVTEAVVVAVVAGIIALAGCYATVVVASALLESTGTMPNGVDLYVPISGILVGLGSAAAVGLLAGIIPAWRALRVSVVAGLRE